MLVIDLVIISAFLQQRRSEMIELCEMVPSQIVDRLPTTAAEDVKTKLKMITNHYNYLQSSLEDRVRLSVKYAEFHSLAADSFDQLDSFSKSSTSEWWNESQSQFGRASVQTQQLHVQLIRAAENLADDLMQVIKRATANNVLKMPVRCTFSLLSRRKSSRCWWFARAFVWVFCT